MHVRRWLFLVAGVSAILTVGCGSVVQSTRKGGPPIEGADVRQLQGLAYWLPKGAIVIDAKWDKDNSDWTITVTPLIEADTSTSSPYWRLRRNVNHLFEDNVTLEVDAKTGLLKTVTGTSEDKTAAIAAEGLAIAAKVMTFGAAGPGAAAGSKTIRAAQEWTPCGKPVEFVGSFRYKMDQLPGDEGQETCETLSVRSPTSTSSSTTSAGPTPLPTPTPTATPITRSYNIVVRRESKRDPRPTKQLDNVTNGIVVRAPAPYRVIITVNNNPNLQAEQLIFLPDKERDYFLPLDRSPFVKNDTQITLVDGVVQKVAVSRPSIILGILGVPKTILDALVPLPH
jgi:hypothetical protein